MSLGKWAWGAGALAGGVMVLVNVLWPDEAAIAPGDDAAAIVNGHVIPVEDVEIALEAMARDSRGAIDQSDARFAIQRLIDEELLFQRGIALDMPRNASNVRRSIVMSMIDFAQANAEPLPPDNELRAFFEANLDFFEAADRYRVSWESAASADAERRRPAAHPPNRMLTATDLRNYLGDVLTGAVQSAAPGETVGPIASGGRVHWITVVEFAPAGETEFETHRRRVEALWQERAAEAALEAYLAELRRSADIEIQPLPSE
ncbi:MULTISPECIES: peptidyl-prolyl cis-trans isomerase [Hyphobacterium]|uniref:Peptidyl-prolyl cis-trans isomerase plp n=1 Tax=Hyphobacterium vulgare TaxID=1736751 RepID=A0ABV7A161_9PROT